MPLIVGVTGSIAAGKSSLCARLVERHGAEHLDADREIHRLYEPDTEAFGRIVAEFGRDVVGADGGIDRKALGAKVFGDASRMEALRAAIGDLPAHFMDLLHRWRSELPADGIGIFEAVNLFDNQYMTVCDAGWLVVCAPGIALRRMVESRGMSEQEAATRLAAAKRWEDQAALADHIFHNDGAPGELTDAIDSAVEALKAAHRSGRLPAPVWRRRG